jgi:predicted nucleic acid-binding Zn ribbon protein
MTYQDDDNNDSGRDEFPDESDMDQEGDMDIVDTVPCPNCGKPVYDGAEQCPRCGNYISAEERPTAKPMWFVIAALVCLAIVLFWMLRLF